MEFVERIYTKTRFWLWASFAVSSYVDGPFKKKACQYSKTSCQASLQQPSLQVQSYIHFSRGGPMPRFNTLLKETWKGIRCPKVLAKKCCIPVRSKKQMDGDVA